LVALVTVVLAALTAGCGDLVRGTGVVETRHHVYAKVTTLVVSSGFTVDLVRGYSTEVSMSLDKRLVPFLRLKRDGRTLHIGLAPGNTYRGTAARAVVTMPSLRRVTAQGNSSVTVSGFYSDSPVAFVASGSSTFALQGIAPGTTTVRLDGRSSIDGSISAGTLKLHMEGASVSMLGGGLHRLIVEANGASHAFMPQMLTDRLHASLAGGSVLTATVRGRIDGSLSDGSSLKYLGHPIIGRVSRSGTSQLTAAGR
jgi:hypothetical protein